MPPVVAFVGSSESGKTTIIEQVVAYLAERGVRVGTIKHAGHPVGFDRPGADSHRHFRAGAQASMVVDGDTLGFVARTGSFDLRAAAERYFPDCDIVIAEGFKNEDVPKIEVHRSATGSAPLYKRLTKVLAVVSDADLPDVVPIAPGDIGAICRVVLDAAGIAR